VKHAVKQHVWRRRCCRGAKRHAPGQDAAVGGRVAAHRGAAMPQHAGGSSLEPRRGIVAAVRADQAKQSRH
jgi:hypothetical protein